MTGRFLRLATCAALLSGVLGQEDNFERPNEATECGTEPLDFLAYGRSLEFTTCTATECEYAEQAGTLFDIKYRQEYKVIEYVSSSENELEEFGPGTATTYILYRCGSEQPNDEWVTERVAANTSTVHFVEIPVTAVANSDSTVGWMLEELGLLDRVRFGSTTGTSPCIQLLAASEDEGGCGRPFIGDYDYSGEEKTDSTEFDAEFGLTSDPEAKKIWMQASADPGPLARAEHIIYLSTFFNAEAKAILYYKDVQASYVDAAGAVETAEDAPIVAWLEAHANGSSSFIMTEDGSPLGEGPAVKMSFARYKALLTRDAGGMVPSQGAALNATGSFAQGDDIVFAASEYPSEEEMFADLHANLEGVDVLIDESFLFTTSDDLLGILGLDGTDVQPTLYPFIGNEDIWRHDKAQSVTGNDDWFGEAVARPDVVHADLKEMITPGSVPNHEFKFFRNFAKNESITMTGPDACTTLTCDAYAQQEAITVGQTVAESATAPGVAEVPEGAEGEEGAEVVEGDSSAGSALMASAVTAGAIIAAML